jgi:hypothetical protein
MEDRGDHDWAVTMLLGMIATFICWTQQGNSHLRRLLTSHVHSLEKSLHHRPHRICSKGWHWKARLPRGSPAFKASKSTLERLIPKQVFEVLVGRCC